MSHLFKKKLVKSHIKHDVKTFGAVEKFKKYFSAFSCPLGIKIVMSNGFGNALKSQTWILQIGQFKWEGQGRVSHLF
jgi:hypothetical protein